MCPSQACATYIHKVLVSTSIKNAARLCGQIAIIFLCEDCLRNAIPVDPHTVHAWDLILFTVNQQCYISTVSTAAARQIRFLSDRSACSRMHTRTILANSGVFGDNERLQIPPESVLVIHAPSSSSHCSHESRS